MTLFRSQPHATPFIDFQIVDLKVVDPAAADPNAPVFILKPSQPFKFVVKVVGTGSIWTGMNVAAAATWQTKFYANALGIDVADSAAAFDIGNNARARRNEITADPIIKCEIPCLSAARDRRV